MTPPQKKEDDPRKVVLGKMLGAGSKVYRMDPCKLHTPNAQGTVPSHLFLFSLW